MEPAFVMPPVELGDVVLWFAQGDASSEALPAIVTRIGHETLCLSILFTNSYNLGLRDGVRHLSDPRRKRPELQENGAWDCNPAAKRRLEGERRLAALEEAYLGK